MSAYTGKHDEDGLSDANRNVVREKLRGLGTPREAHPEMFAIVYMLGCAGAALIGAMVVCGHALWVWMGGGS